MKIINESGVLPSSERYFSTPSAVARRLFYYITRCGHYYCSNEYDFRDTCETAHQKSHQNYLLDYIRIGSLNFETEGKSYTAEAGQIAFIDCRKPHRYYVTSYAERIWVHIDGANLDDFHRQILSFRGRHIFTPSPESHIERKMMGLLTTIKNGGTHSESDISQQIYSILCSLLFQPVNQNARLTNPVNQAMSYINQHLFDSLSVSDIAARVNLSPSHFSRQFRSQTGFSPHEYIVVHRIDEAKALLYTTNLSIKEIAYQTGYHSEVNFIASFTKNVGVSPSVFRKMQL